MTITRARELMGESAENLSDEDVQNYINTAEVMSEIAIDMVIKKINLASNENTKT